MHLPLLAAVLLAAPTSAALINLIPVQVSKRMCPEGAPITHNEREMRVCVVVVSSSLASHCCAHSSQLLVTVTPDPAERIVQCMLLWCKNISVLHSRAFARGGVACALCSQSAYVFL
jgi:hypothetical protein